MLALSEYKSPLRSGDDSASVFWRLINSSSLTTGARIPAHRLFHANERFHMEGDRQGFLGAPSAVHADDINSGGRFTLARAMARPRDQAEEADGRISDL